MWAFLTVQQYSKFLETTKNRTNLEELVVTFKLKSFKEYSPIPRLRQADLTWKLRNQLSLFQIVVKKLSCIAQIIFIKAISIYCLKR